MDADDAARVTKLYAEGGLERQAVSPSELQKIEPALTGKDYYGGFFTPSDFTGDIHRCAAGRSNLPRSLLEASS